MHYVGIDLHSNNSYVAVKNETGKPIFHKRFRNNLDDILSVLNRWNDIQGIIVESTYNWYWLVDGLKQFGHTVHLANPSKMKQYDGLKCVNDKTDAFHLAEMLRVGNIHTGYIYPEAQRPLRDFLRRRLRVVRQRAQNITHFQSLLARNHGTSMPGQAIKALTEKEVEGMFKVSLEVENAKILIRTIRFLGVQVKDIEKTVNKALNTESDYHNLMTVPGIGKIIASTIYLETGDISRFPTVNNFSSYCRVVKSIHTSNDKKKGGGNRKNGNAYLSWAFGEAATLSKAHSTEAKRFFDRKERRTNTPLAYRALAHKLARMCYFIMRDGSVYDPGRIFGK